MALEQDLDLSIADALSNVDQLGSQLESAAQVFAQALLDALDEVANQQVTVEADATAVTDEVSSAVDEGASVTPIITADVEADTTEAEASIDAIQPPPVVVEVQADTTEAVQQVDNLDRGIAAAADELFASGRTAGLIQNVLGGIPPAATAAIGGVAALTAVTTQFFDAAIESETAVASFNQRLGSMATEVENIDVAGLDTSIDDLAISLGGSDEALRTSAASIFQFGEAAGASEEQAALAAENVAALAAAAVAANPALGDVGDVAQNLSRALLSGRDRALAPFGISLNRAAIDAEAMQQGLADANGEVSSFERILVGSDLAIQQFGGSLQDEIAAGSENAGIQLAALKTRLSETFETAGAPLVVPILDLLTAAEPLLTTIVGIVGELAEALVSLATPFLEAFAPVLDQQLQPFLTALQGLQPALAELGQAAGELVIALSPLIVNFSEGFAAAIAASGPVISFTAQLVSVFAELTTQAVALFEALGPLGEVLAGLNPALGPLAPLLGGVDFEIANMAVNAEEAASKIPGLTDELFGVVDSAQAFIDGTEDIPQRLTDMQIAAEDSTFNQFAGALGDAGVSAREFANIIAAGDTKLDDLEESLRAAGISANVIDEILAGAREEAEVFGEVAEAQLDELVALGLLNEAQRESLDERFGLTTATADYRGALEEVSAALQFVTILEEQQAEAERQAALNAQFAGGAVNEFVDAVVAGEVTSSNFATAVSDLGLEVEFAQAVFDGLRGKINEFTASILETVPSAVEILSGIEDATNPQIVIDNLNQQAVAISQFGENLQFLIDTVGPQFARLAAESGPQFTQQIAQGIRDGDPEIITALQESTANFDSAFTGLNNRIINDIAPQLGLSAAEVAEVINANLASGVPGAEQIGADIGAGVEKGMLGSIVALQAVAFLMIDSIIATARAAADANSPSRLFAELGRDLSAGMAIGIEDGAQEAVDAAEQIVRDAASAVAGIAAPLPVGIGSTGTTGGNTTSLTLQVTVPPGTADPQAFGEAVARPITAEIEALLRSTVSTA